MERTIEATKRGGDGSGSGTHPSQAAGRRPALVGQEIGGCRIIELVGTGAMGAVYAATQIQLDRKVALKIIHPELWQNERVLKRFQQEARAVGKLSSPYVVQIHQVGFEDGVNYLVMEFVAGGNLRTFAARQPQSRITSEEAVKFLRQCCLGLKEAQANGILHRDIKPDNLLLDRNGDVKIADFGLAKTLGDRLDLTASSDLMGTPLYMSPEQCSGVELDFRSDMYSLGASFYYLLTAQPPAEGKTIFEVIQTKTRLQCLSPAAALPELAGVGPLSRVIEKMTALAVEDRYESYDALLRDLDRVGRGEVVSGVRHRARGRERSKVPVVVGVVLALALGGGALWYFDPLGWRPALVADPPDRDPPGEDPEARQREEAERLRLAEEAARKQREQEERDAEEAAERERLERERAMRARTERFDGWQAEFDKMRGQLRAQGPTDSVKTEARRLLEDMPEDSDSTLKESTRKLVNDIADGYEIHNKLHGMVPPTTIELPFTDVEQYVEQVRATLTLRDPGPELADWLARRRVELLDAPDLRDRCRARLNQHWTRCRDHDIRKVETELQQRDVETDLLKLADAKARLCKVFPELREPLDTEIPDAELTARVQALANRRLELVLLADIGAALARVQGLGSLAAWGPAKQEIGASVSRLRTRAEELAARYPDAAVGLSAAIKQLSDEVERWGKFSSHLGSGLIALGRGDLKTARGELGKLDKLPGEVPELGRLRLALDAFDRAILELLERGNVALAREQFGVASDELSRLGKDAAAARARVVLWQDRLQELEVATKNTMVAVPPPFAVEPDDRPAVTLSPYFIDRREVSRGDFRNFLIEASKDGSAAAAAFTSKRARERAIERLPDLRDIAGRDENPVDGLNYYEAAAYMAWQKKSLPSLAEWWLAARGPKGKSIQFPWGNTWSKDSAHRNDGRFLVRVWEGGESARIPDLRHLAGNVAEWLEQEEAGATRGYLAGGSCFDDEEVQYALAQGRRQPCGLGESLKGNGCRGVLRIKVFFADLLVE